MEPRYEGAKGLAKCVLYIDCEVSLYQGSFLFIYFAITGVKKIVRYTEDFVISRFHCSGDKKRTLTKESAVVTMLY